MSNLSYQYHIQPPWLLLKPIFGDGYQLYEEMTQSKIMLVYI